MPVATLIVKRPLLNAKPIIKWAKSVGFETTLLPEDMHVTQAYSKTPIDWEDVGPDLYSDSKGRLIIPANDGPRSISPLGDKGAVVCKFQSSALHVRHKEISRAGASWDFPSYMPHFSLTYSGQNLDCASIVPWQGEIILGPEVFAEIIKNFAGKVEEAATREYDLLAAANR